MWCGVHPERARAVTLVFKYSACIQFENCIQYRVFIQYFVLYTTKTKKIYNVYYIFFLLTFFDSSKAGWGVVIKSQNIQTLVIPFSTLTPPKNKKTRKPSNCKGYNDFSTNEKTIHIIYIGKVLVLKSLQPSDCNGYSGFLITNKVSVSISASIYLDLWPVGISIRSKALERVSLSWI